jgi:hypothetical protein
MYDHLAALDDEIATLEAEHDAVASGMDPWAGEFADAPFGDPVEGIDDEEVGRFLGFGRPTDRQWGRIRARRMQKVQRWQQTPQGLRTRGRQRKMRRWVRQRDRWGRGRSSGLISLGFVG